MSDLAPNAGMGLGVEGRIRFYRDGRNFTAGQWIRQWGLLVLMCVIAFVMLFPLVWMVITSLKTQAEVTAHPFGLLPHSMAWQNYADAWKNVEPYFRNSVLLAVLTVGGTLAIASLAGYGFARFDFPGRNIAFLFLLGTAIIPNIVYIVPQYLLFQQIGWIDTLYPLWVPKALTPIFGTFLMRQAFLIVPRELEEAALIDGASRLQVFWSVMLPQTKPALAALGIFAFIDSWNDLFSPLIFTQSQRLQTLPLALAQYQGDFLTSVGLLMAATTIAVVPVVVIFVFAQRYFVEAITSTGIKG